MTNTCMTLLTMVVWPLAGAAVGADWTPQKDTSKAEGLVVSGRALDVFTHGVKPAWGYASRSDDHGPADDLDHHAIAAPGSAGSMHLS